MAAAMTLLVIIALVAALAGLLLASQATAGVAVVGVGCIMAIFARMAQASVHHEQRR